MMRNLQSSSFIVAWAFDRALSKTSATAGHISAHTSEYLLPISSGCCLRERAISVVVPDSWGFSLTGDSTFWLLLDDVMSIPLLRKSDIPISPLAVGELPCLGTHLSFREEADVRSLEESWCIMDIFPVAPV